MAISGSTRIAGVLGHPIAHTLSPAMHNAAYAALGLDWVYVPFDAADDVVVARVFDLARVLPMVGLNVTMPWKRTALESCDEVASTAQMAGAVNTIHVVDGRLIGYNTDARGLLEALEREAGFDPAGRNVVILGAGGAAGAAMVAGLLGDAASISIVNRTLERAEELIERGRPHVRVGTLQAVLTQDAEAAVAEADLLVNCTPVGMQPTDASPVPRAWLRPDLVVMDMVYRVEPTRLVMEAREAGATALDGLPMLVAQGALALDIWNPDGAHRAPRDVMQQAAREQLLWRAESGDTS